MNCNQRLLIALMLGVMCAAASAGEPMPRKVQLLQTKTGDRFGIWGEKPKAPAPTLFILASGISDALGSPYFRQCGNVLAEHGYLCASVDLPGLSSWSGRCQKGEDFVAEVNRKMTRVLDHLIADGYTDPAKVAICGTSRGGFLALHFAAHDERVRCAVGYAPVTVLTAMEEFRAAKDNELAKSLALSRQADKLAGRAVWIAICEGDSRVGTEHAVDLARRIKDAASARKLEDRVELHVAKQPRGHTTPPGASAKSAEWILKQLGGGKAK